ncbi:putative enoyl CoA hydratase [Gonapodya sp. JEL0774]|nr:putative enoyl CoA hydratase [Gonapodya sp. JEL0774]
MSLPRFVSHCVSQSPAIRPSRLFHLSRPVSSSPAPSSPAPASSDPVTVQSLPNGVAIITLNRPKTLNALTEEVGDAFVEVVKVGAPSVTGWTGAAAVCGWSRVVAGTESLSSSSSLRCVVLTGAGRAFSAGGDMGFLRNRISTTPGKNVEVMRSFYSRFLSVRTLPVPTIAAVNGPAIGAGLCLALACDMRVVERGSKVGVNFVRIGMHPGMAGSHLLPHLIGPQLASRLLLTGDLITGAEALSYGLAMAAPETGEAVVEEALAVAGRVARASPVAVRGTTRTMRMRTEDGMERALQREADAQAHGYASPDYPEGLAAILEKREPVFRDFDSYGAK